MKRAIGIILILTLVLVLGGCNAGNSIKNTPISQENVANANKLVDLLEAGDFVGATAYFDDNMKKQLPAEKLAEAWEILVQQVGTFEKKLETQTEIQSEFEIAHVISQFQKAKVDIKVVFDKNGLISGLWFQPVK